MTGSNENIVYYVMRSAAYAAVVVASFVAFHIFNSQPSFSFWRRNRNEFPITEAAAIAAITFTGSLCFTFIVDWFEKEPIKRPPVDGYNDSGIVHKLGSRAYLKGELKPTRSVAIAYHSVLEDEETETEVPLAFLDSSLAFPVTPVPPNSPKVKVRPSKQKLKTCDHGVNAVRSSCNHTAHTSGSRDTEEKSVDRFIPSFLLGAPGIISIAPPKEFYEENDAKRFEPSVFKIETKNVSDDFGINLHQIDAEQPLKPHQINADEPLNPDQFNADESLNPDQFNAEEPLNPDQFNADEPLNPDQFNADEPLTEQKTEQLLPSEIRKEHLCNNVQFNSRCLLKEDSC